MRDAAHAGRAHAGREARLRQILERVISYGLQAGVQKYSYAMLFMRESDLAYLDSSSGWEVGVGPSITVIDQGKAASMTSTTAREGVYVIFYDQKGRMAGLGIQGLKITKLD